MTDTDFDEAPAPWVLTPAEFAATKNKLEKINARAIKRGFTGRIDITATVKNHEDYKGTKQAVVNRPKLIEKPTTENEEATK